MSVSWETKDCEAYETALKAAEVSGEFDYKVPTWDIFCDLREALIWGMLGVKFPAKSSWGITEENWEAVYLRLRIYEKVTGCSRIYNNGRHKSREMYFQPEEIKSMIGFSVNSGNQTDAQFKKYIQDKLLDDAQQHLKSYKRDLEKENPYEWEYKYGKPRSEEAA